jgi:hypothetical protein
MYAPCRAYSAGCFLFSGIRLIWLAVTYLRRVSTEVEIRLDQQVRGFFLFSLEVMLGMVAK